MSLTVGYSGLKGTHIASALTRYNQIPISLLDKYGFRRSRICGITALAVAAVAAVKRGGTWRHSTPSWPNIGPMKSCFGSKGC